MSKQFYRKKILLLFFVFMWLVYIRVGMCVWDMYLDTCMVAFFTTNQLFTISDWFWITRHAIVFDATNSLCITVVFHVVTCHCISLFLLYLFLLSSMLIYVIKCTVSSIYMCVHIIIIIIILFKMWLYVI